MDSLDTGDGKDHDRNPQVGKLEPVSHTLGEEVLGQLPRQVVEDE